MKSVVEYYLNQGDKDLGRIIGNIHTDLDGRFTVVRSSESNLGNFVCDIILEVYFFGKIQEQIGFGLKKLGFIFDGKIMK